MTSILMIASGKGGVGKSFVASNIACCLKSLGYSVLLIDFSFGSRNDDSIIGITDSVLYNINDILNGSCTIDEAIVSGEKCYQPDFIAASPNQTDLISNYDALLKCTKQMFRLIKKKYSFVIIDCPHPSGNIFDVCCFVSTHCIALTADEFFSVNNTALMTLRMNELCSGDKYLLINNITDDERVNDLSAEDIIDEIGIKIIGIIPYDKFVYQSIVNGDPIVRYNTDAGVALENTCRRILGEKIPYVIHKKSKNLFERNKLILKTNKEDNNCEHCIDST